MHFEMQTSGGLITHHTSEALNIAMSAKNESNGMLFINTFEFLGKLLVIL